MLLRIWVFRENGLREGHTVFMVVSEVTFRRLEALRYSWSKEYFHINLCIALRATPSAVLLSSCPSRDSDHKCISGNVKYSTCLALCSDYTAINISRLVKFETSVHDSTSETYYDATFRQMGDKNLFYLSLVCSIFCNEFFWGRARARSGERDSSSSLHVGLTHNSEFRFTFLLSI
jgi:hypothetical protein